MEVTRVERLAEGVAIQTPHATLVAARASDGPPECELHFALPDGATRVAYAPQAPGPSARREVEIDPFLRGNAFRAIHDSPRALAAMLSIAAGRRVESGPESERVFVALRGNGLVFLENGDTLRYATGDAIVVPAGEPVRLWAQGPEDALLVVMQPRMAAAPRRTLAGEIARIKGAAVTAAAEDDTRSSP